MKVIWLKADQANMVSDLALCLGYFDGMHLAHQKLFSMTLEKGKEFQVKTAIMTFSTQIHSYLKHEKYYFLTSVADKEEVAKALGFDYLFVLEVSDTLVRMEPDEFIRKYIASQRHIVVGYDYRFGHFGKGNALCLYERFPEKVIIVPEMDYYGKKIGSSRIRELLKKGKLNLVSHLLGRPYQIIGEVVYGHRRGKSLGYPTANIDFDGYFLPRTGVYLTTIIHKEKKFHAMTNVGYNPTFREQELSLETYIFDLDEDLYTQTITVRFHEYIRPEMQFKNREQLVEQLKKDETTIRKLIASKEGKI